MLDKENKRIRAPVPLTTPRGKIRIKSRNMCHEYGVPHFKRSGPFHQNNYVEWQISYSLEDNPENKDVTSLPNVSFMSVNGKKKIFYELSEYLYYLHSWGIIPTSEIQSTLNLVSSLDEAYMIFNHLDIRAPETLPVKKEINGTLFYETILEYPKLVYKLGKFGIITEILMKERQYAAGLQPMLYFCLPITELKVDKPILERKAYSNECGQFIIDETNSNIVIEMIRMFGMLSPSHNHDAVEILKVVLS